MKKVFILVFVLLTLLSSAQNSKPKIGLVLSGGGAKGLAHIGVLEEIDQSGLQLDYIGGTSMGAIIGGLYAAGYSAKQIKEILSQINLTDILQDKYPRNALPFFEKEFGEKHAFTLPVTKSGIQLPRAVSKGQNVLDLFTYLLSPVSEIEDFSKLQVPFFCIGTNVENGEQVLLENGFLPLALRASGAFPTLLNPVDFKGKLLIDGGIANNFPVDIMKAKGVDYIIGVDVQSDLNKRENLNSVISILNQIVSYDVYRERKDRLKLLDTYIQPDIGSFSVVDFDKGFELVKKGEEIAKKYRSVFDSLAQLQKTKFQKGLLFSDKPFYIKSIQVNGTKKTTPAYVKGKLKIQKGDSITHRELRKRIDFLTATENYERVDYRVKKGKTGKELIFNVIESKLKSNIRLGIHYDLLYESAILANYNTKGLLIKNDQLSVDAILGDNLRFNMSYFVDNGFYTSYGFRSRYNHLRTDTKAFNKSALPINTINLGYTDFTHELFLQTRFNRKFAMGLGAELKNIKITTETVLNNNVRTTFDNSSYLNLHGYLKLDTYDDKHYVKKGFYADLGARWYTYSTDYNNNFKRFAQLSGTIGFATTFWDKLTFQYTNDAGFSFENPDSDVFDFYLGGYNQNYINTFVRFYGYDFAELSGNSFLRSEFKFRYQLFKNNYAIALANYARVDDNVFKNTQIFRNSLSGYALGYSLNTFIGPVEIMYSWSPNTNNNFWLFNLGFWF